MSKHFGAFLGGLLVGSAVGAVAGMLVAPRTGRETRRILKKSADALPELAEDLSSTFQVQADRFSESTLYSWQGTLARLRDALAIGLEAGQLEVRDLQQTNHEPQSSEAVSGNNGGERPASPA
ncbi:gas vesicle protein [Rubidibacter lacunae KORDI 51-2]|uniref:Gas vesicle protein n=1 Tax=Rubidibacter lacunae KORDI 51-2 TaxID=582515 RepID=U5DDI1_9CHRO|nr:YtxH domain-containing protein [Rubidibacter lacunae]ERN42563.1 gas vesicle protein [Rubidibacter lacunae KORDI 51-2]